jgi:hypothetical protein
MALARAVSDEALSREILNTVAELLKNSAQDTSRVKMVREPLAVRHKNLLLY